MSTCEYGAGSNDMPGHQDLINKMGLTLSERADLGLAWPGYGGEERLLPGLSHVQNIK